MKRLFLSSFAANVFVRFLNLWTGILGARFLGPFGRGELAAANRWSNLFVLLFTIGLPGAVIFYGKQSRERQGEYISAYLIVGTIVGIVGFVVGELVVPHLFYHQPPQLIRLAQISMISVPFGIVADGLVGTMLTLNMFGKVIGIRLLGETGTFLVIITLICFGRYTVGYFIIVNLLWSVVVFAFTVYLVLRSVKLDFSWLWLNVRVLLLKGVHIYSAALVTMFGANIDQLVMSLFLTPYTLGLYAVGASIGGILPGILGATLGNYLWPKLMDLSTHERKLKIEKIHGVLMYGSLGVSIITGSVLPFLLPLVYGSKFGAATAMTEIMLLSTPVSIGYLVITYLLSTENRFSIITIAEALGLASGLMVTLPLIHFWEGVGAAVGVLVANLVKWVYLLVYSRRLDLSFAALMSPYLGSFVSLFRVLTEKITSRRTVTN
ncbi:oligosaccharide flippase family protein [Alicyclobacillus mengziensis]|uniref:Oligosaccharide flippase family protein n=1 Tax=Alicyclobacillus mengziensis TaxID=2931921 RepID=A0A9X7Z5R9_9BACL|nr:oligosaccharide flippase family protein [Alicyclobacillus mengziensis]QSO45453.1 oligosaccharide flippase family protein [Alicyclobacillus mengziensis]